MFLQNISVCISVAKRILITNHTTKCKNDFSFSLQVTSETIYSSIVSSTHCKLINNKINRFKDVPSNTDIAAKLPEPIVVYGSLSVDPCG